MTPVGQFTLLLEEESLFFVMLSLFHVVLFCLLVFFNSHIIPLLTMAILQTIIITSHHRHR